MHFLASIVTGTVLAAASFLPFFHGGGRVGSSTPPRPYQEDMASSTMATTIACVGSAVSVREQAVDTAETSFTAAVTMAYTNRASALASAYTQTTGDNSIRMAVQEAWQGFASSTKSAQKIWRSARMSAWQTFATAAKMCKAPPSITDMNNMSLEISGQ